MKEKRSAKKSLSYFDAMVTAFGAMIGWGWVISTGSWIEEAGVLGTVLGFIIGGVMIFFVGLSYSELTTAVPTSGGTMMFTKLALGPGAAYACSWMLTLSYIGVVCFEACAVPTVIQYIFPNFLKGYLYSVGGFDIYASWLIFAIAASLLISYVNIRGIKAAAKLQTVLTISIAAAGLLLVGASAFGGEAQNLSSQLMAGEGLLSKLKNIFAIAAVSPFYLLGFDVIPQIADEIDIPLRKIGSLMLFSIILAVAFYVLVVLAVGYVLLPQELETSMKLQRLVTADAMEKAFSSGTMAKVLIIGGICGIITSWNSFLIGGSRILAAMARERMLPGWFAYEHRKYGTPVNAILLIALLTLLSIFAGGALLNWIADTASFACCATYVFVALSFLILRKKQPELQRPYKVKSFRLVGTAALLMSLVMLLLYLIPGSGSTFEKEEWIILGIWLLLGTALAVRSKIKYGSSFCK